MEQKEIRTLRADEIECRVGTINENGLSLLLYKDARADMKILDEVYGVTGWQRRHEMIGGSLYCIVSIWDEDKQQWISKMDVGTESYTEKEKGQASDSFKRACVSLGIGRELYTAPFIWVGAEVANIKMKDGRPTTRDRFTVTEIRYSNSREIIALTIVNQDARTVYRLNEKKTAASGKKSDAAPSASSKKQSEPDKVQVVNQELARTGVALDAVLARYGVTSIQDMTEETYRKALSSLKKTKTRAA